MTKITKFPVLFLTFTLVAATAYAAPVPPQNPNHVKLCGLSNTPEYFHQQMQCVETALDKCDELKNLPEEQRIDLAGNVIDVYEYVNACRDNIGKGGNLYTFDNVSACTISYDDWVCIKRGINTLNNTVEDIISILPSL
jgi:hypothetical protein